MKGLWLCRWNLRNLHLFLAIHLGSRPHFVEWCSNKLGGKLGKTRSLALSHVSESVPQSQQCSFKWRSWERTFQFLLQYIYIDDVWNQNKQLKIHKSWGQRETYLDIGRLALQNEDSSCNPILCSYSIQYSPKIGPKPRMFGAHSSIHFNSGWVYTPITFQNPQTHNTI